jgi:16S rRNA (uracil1498-N3)-methyltransferase
MSVPFFYIDSYDPLQKDIILDEDNSRHIVQVLRMKEGELLNVTDGKGSLLSCEIIDPHKKHCLVKVKDSRFMPARRSISEGGTHDSRQLTIGISLLKNANRFEWFLEKATEIGITHIIPLLCARTEKEKFRHERLNQICISAMLQSQQAWLPVLTEPQPVDEVIRKAQQQQKFIAHCIDESKSHLADLINESLSSQVILIGPEGDFTGPEIALALEHHFIPVSLGETRLRTETAGVVAAALLCNP